MNSNFMRHCVKCFNNHNNLVENLFIDTFDSSDRILFYNCEDFTNLKLFLGCHSQVISVPLIMNNARDVVFKTVLSENNLFEISKYSINLECFVQMTIVPLVFKYLLQSFNEYRIFLIWSVISKSWVFRF